MSALKELKPSLVWNYFDEICKIPRPSKKEEKIIAFLQTFGAEHQLDTKTDDAGNILICKPATKGFENRKTIILQSHIDMVCEKNSDTIHDFEKDPIIPYIDHGWVKAKGTTLGADDGIGIAAQLAILASDKIEHGPIECLFTIDEETGLSGAFALQPGFLKGKILINLDSEDEGELFIGCAGGIDTVGYLDYNLKDAKGYVYNLEVKGLRGGHSGDDIHKGYGNAVKIINRILWLATKKYSIGIVNIDAGNLRNAIAREAFATIVVKDGNETKLQEFVSTLSGSIKEEFKATEPNLEINLTLTHPGLSLVKRIDNVVQERLLNMLYACPHGVIAWSHEILNLVETSTNLASVKMKENNIVISTSQRSSVTSAKKDIAAMVESVFMLGGAVVEHSDGYPGWKPNTNSEIMNITRASYKRIFTETPYVRAIHAGLECGLFLEKYPDMDMISFGPTIKGAHSPDERIEIESVIRFWDLLIDVLTKIPENN